MFSDDGSAGRSARHFILWQTHSTRDHLSLAAGKSGSTPSRDCHVRDQVPPGCHRAACSRLSQKALELSSHSVIEDDLDRIRKISPDKRGCGHRAINVYRWPETLVLYRMRH